MFKAISDGYQSLWKSIIRPPRESYDDKDLGPKEFMLGDRTFERTDFYIISVRGAKILCSHFEPIESERTAAELPCVIYLHGNCSCRLEGLTAVPLLLPANSTVVAFDWAGCGNSEGEYISLGFYERYDLEKLVNYLRENRRVGCIGLWGRSMGAVTAIYHASQNLQITSLVLDSPFASLRKLATHLSKKYSSAPNFILNFLYGRVKTTIKEKADFDIDELNPIDKVGFCYQPALFVTGKDDDFVPSTHTQEVYEAYEGDKDIMYVEGNHNAQRPKQFLERVADFFYTTLLCEKIPMPLLDNLPEFIGRRTFGNDAYDLASADYDALYLWALERSLKEM